MAYRATPRLSLGLEHNAAAGELNPVGNWIAHSETVQWPMVSFGTSSDRIFTPAGFQTYYVSFAKMIPNSPFAPYVSVNYSEYERGFNFPLGINIALAPEWDLLPMNDGRRSHLLLTYKAPSMNTTLMLIDLRRPKIGISLGFGF